MSFTILYKNETLVTVLSEYSELKNIGVYNNKIIPLMRYIPINMNR